MTSKLLQIKKAAIEGRMADLSKAYAAANNQLNSTINHVDMIKIKNQIIDIEAQFAQAERELAQIENSDPDYNRRHLEFKTHFPKIDFEHIDKSLQHITDQFGGEGFAALFLMQNNIEMGGKWCIARMRERLIYNAGHFKEYPVEFSPVYGTPNKYLILDSLARYLDIAPDYEDVNRYSQGIIRGICESIQTGGVIFVEMRGWDYLQSQDEVLTWFIENFWSPLLQELPKFLETRRKAKLIFVIVTESEIKAECLSSLLCHNEDQYSSEKIFNLILRNWTKNEIRDWLDTFSVSFSTQRLLANQIDKIVDIVYRASKNGMPALVHSTLQDYFFKEN
jgi:hypothetical protein